MKRLFDILFSAFGLLILSPLFLVVAVIVKLDSKGHVFFRQERIGRDFKPFLIYKFRSMKEDEDGGSLLITGGEDRRITRAGRLLRRTKLDELPQLINVLRGEMSLVGPRPELRRFVELFRSDYEKLLRVRPGITDPASKKFFNEESVLSPSTGREEDYINRILPEKIRLSSDYVDNHNVLLDVQLIIETIFKI